MRFFDVAACICFLIAIVFYTRGSSSLEFAAVAVVLELISLALMPEPERMKIVRDLSRLPFGSSMRKENFELPAMLVLVCPF
ncbi:MAG TPA: hypothetical protein PKN29_13915 [Candidatus Ozemobacteraceae bacterium]|nr:hypothetical protein [Candidatus Ozemobacteraceae bacterium]